MTDAPKTTKRNTRKPDPMTAILNEIKAERKAQADEWGKQDLPFTGGSDLDKGRAYFHYVTGFWKAVNEQRKARGTLGFDGLLIETANRLVAEEDAVKRRAWLVHLGALLVDEVERMDQGGRA